MNEKSFFKIRLYLTGAVTIAVWALLAWNYYHGGVPSHHIGANEDLPAISNAWGALLLPLLTWFLLYRIQKRAFGNKGGYTEPLKILQRALYGFAGALLFGILISVCFTFGYADITGNLVLGLLPLAIFFPLYRAECLLGFVIGMTFTFGAVLPTGFGTMLVLVSLVLYLIIRPTILYVLSKVGLIGSFSQQ
jgi:hypothetical protein